MSFEGTGWIIVIFVTLGNLASRSWKGHLKKLQDKRRNVNSSFCETCLHWVWAEDLNAFSLTDQGDLPHNQRNSQWIRAIKLSCPPAPLGTRLRGWQGFWQWASTAHDRGCTQILIMLYLKSPNEFTLGSLPFFVVEKGPWKLNQLTKKRLNQSLKTTNLTLWAPLLYSVLVLLMPFCHWEIPQGYWFWIKQNLPTV